MSRVLRTAATGMMAQQMFVDVIANNLANVNTTGFKRSKIEFQDLLYQTIRSAGSSNLQGTYVPTELQIGAGTRPVSTNKIFSQGELVFTNNQLDVAIEGDGFFQVIKPDTQEIVYTRDGTFKISRDQELVTSDGFIVEPQITIPIDALRIDISKDGYILAIVPNQVELSEIGQLELVRFINPSGLKSIGQNLLQATYAAGDPVPSVPGQDGAGTILQGYLELSNVDVVEEMVNMIVAQRAFEMSSKAVQAADDMMNTTNNLRR